MTEINYGDTFEETLKQWASECGNLKLYTGVDTGATNTRVALGDEKNYVCVATFKCDSTRDLVSTLSTIADRVNEIIDCKKFVKSGCIAAAGRVSDFGTSVEITNYRGGEDNKHRNMNLNELPVLLFPENHSRIINDLESTCYGISGLSGRKVVNEYFDILLGPDEESNTPELSFQHYLVIAVGTGMGVGLIMALGDRKEFVVLPLEGGHILLSKSPVKHCRREEEDRMVNYITDELYQGENSLEYEDLVSGRGLAVLYKFFAQDSDDESVPKELSPAEVSKKALEGEKCASKALLYHYLYLARGSANLAVCLGAKGIFWAGGNQISNHAFVEEHREQLHAEFLNHPKEAWLKPVPIFVQKKQVNVNIEGTLYLGRVVLA